MIERYPALNVVINNAGVMPFDDAQARRLADTNLLGPVRVSAAFVEQFNRLIVDNPIPVA